ncbi:MAG: hypothetical protein ACFB4I_19265 [Cyanophyceae cyanobacterium]
MSTRIVLTLIGVLSRAFVERGFGKQYSWTSHLWLDLWGVWDTFWYMDIAQNGYSTIGPIESSPAQTNFAFFPLYPLLMSLLGRITGGNYYLAGIVISNVCLLVACYLLYRLVEMESDRPTARRSLKYLFLYPVAFIFSGVFTESLYLCLVLLCFYLSKRQHWLLAGIAGAFLSATRTLGVLIALPLLFEYGRSIEFKPSKIRLDILFVLLIPLGLMGFALYSYSVTGDFLFFKTNQAAWGREITNPLTALWIGLQRGLIESNPTRLLEFGFSVAALLLLNVFITKIGWTYWLFSMYSLLIPLAAGINSMPRYTLPIFPLFIVLAKLSRNESWDDALTLFLGLLQGCLMVFWCTGQALVV